MLLRNGSLFAYGADRTLANPMSVNSTTSGGTSTFIGDYSLILNGNWSYSNTTTGHTLTNTVAAGKSVTLNGNMVLNSITNAVSLAFNGTGDTVLGGNITSTTALAVNLSYTGTGTMTVSGTNSTGGSTTLNSATGTLAAGSDNAFGSGALLLTAGTFRSAGGLRTIANNVTHGGTVILGGTDGLKFNGIWTNSGNNRTLTVNTTAGVELAGEVRLSEHATTGRTLTINGSSNVLISGAVTNGTGTGASALAYSGTAILTLSATNTYTGSTTVSGGGTLRLTGSGRLGTGALTVSNGTVELTGTVNSNVTTLTLGGVAAVAPSVNIGAGQVLTATAVTYTGTTGLTGLINGAGTLNLGTAGITVTVADNTANAVDMSWAMTTLTGSGTFIKAGAGTLDISGITSNNFTGSIQISAGDVLGLAALNNNIALNGGVYSTSGTFTRSLGTGDNQVQWLAGGGGFAAVGGDLTVSISGGPDPLVWAGTPSFVPNAAPLIFGSLTATGVVDFTNNINLNGATRTVNVVDNTSVTTDKAVLSGVLSNGTLDKTGTGILELHGANTFGTLTVTAGTLQFSTVTNNGGAASNLGSGTNGITLVAGRLQFIGNTNQVTNRTITLTGAGIIDASGVGGATITLAQSTPAASPSRSTAAATASSPASSLKPATRPISQRAGRALGPSTPRWSSATT
ncbi:MAG: autotransporter-associated beta strand repeat-containing protein [Pirellulales bacterium]